MSSFAELASLLWWLMLLSATAIILNDIVTAIPRKREKSRIPNPREKLTANARNETDSLARRIRRSLQRPGSFRALRKEVAQTIVSAACVAKGLPASRAPAPELVRKLLSDPELVKFVEEQFSEETTNRRLQRGEVVIEFERMTRVLEKAASELA